MDFSYLLELAKANEEKTKSAKSIRFSTKVSNAKKLEKSGPKPEAINQLLTKIKVDKEKEKEKYIKQRDELLALREKDGHSKKRIRSLINRTVGASKSVLEDAKDITTAIGETQCDEDDYGYESAITQKIFSSLQNKYSALPEDERLKFQKTKKSSIEDIKNRVMSSLKQEQEEGLGLRKRKRNRKSKHKDDDDDGFINDGDSYKKFKSEKRKNEEESGKRKNDDESEESSKRVKKNSKYDIDPSLIDTKVDKYAKFKYDKKEKVKHRDNKSGKKSVKSASAPSMSFEELMKVAQKKQKDPVPIINPLKEILEKKEKPKVDEARPLTAKEKKEIEEDKLRRLRKMGKLPPKEEPSKLENHKKDQISNNKSNQPPPPNKVTKEKKIVTEAPKKNLDRSKYFALPKPKENNIPKAVVKAAPDNKIEKVSNAENKYNKPPPSKGTTLKETKKLSHPPKPAIKQKPPTQSSYRRIDSDEEEEDSDMDDFIDDGDVDLDYSNEIAKLFKYDKSKYVDEDDDVDDMEASYSQLQKEEKISAKIGLMEDLEDMRREEEEKKRKKMLLKKRK